MKTFLLCAALMLAPAAMPQSAPLSANQSKPTGICKDGSFTNTSVRDGACHGHKGLKQWYGASVPSQPVPTPTASPSLPAPAITNGTSTSLPVPTPTRATSAYTIQAPTPAASIPSEQLPTAGTAATISRPVPTPTTSTPSQPVPDPAQITVQPRGIAAERARMAAMPPAAGGGPGMVWVNNTSNVYHCPGSDFYGKTKNGAYMTEADAKASGAHPNRNKPCR